MFIDKNKFLTPELKYRVKPIIHGGWHKGNPKPKMDAIKELGYGGAVINPKWSEGFYADDENVDDLATAIDYMDKEGLSFWLYDECGYPSGYALGRTLEGHPELEAKGLYMIRRVAYEPRHTTFTIDDETDKIVWAAKYPLEIVNIAHSYVQYDKMEPVPFTDTFVECDLNKNEALFIFCVKPAYEGSHCTHNVCSHSRYINVMDEKAVRRFIDITYEKIYNRCPDAYKKAEAVFTDEPSLMTSYTQCYETWPYALAPWVDGLFEEYEREYGTSILPYLPLVFEGREEAFGTRIKFYDLVGKLIARAYSGQLSKWCRAHGTKFSGHYLGEESIQGHVIAYGSFIPVLLAADYPGIDVLTGRPEDYDINTAKFAQIAVRKNKTNGMMVELGTYYCKPDFALDPWGNMMGVMTILALGGVRKFNTYFKADFSQCNPELKESGYKGVAECRQFNEYAGRLCYMLDNVMNECNTFVYYAVEDAQAKYVPQHSAAFGTAAGTADAVTGPLVRKIYSSGFDFYYADKDDLLEAEKSIKKGKPTISGNEVKTVIVPGVDVCHSESVRALKVLSDAGVKVLFVNKVPSFGTETSETKLDEYFEAVSVGTVIEHLKETDNRFTVTAEGIVFHKARFTKDGKEMYLVYNNTRGKDAEVTFNHKEKLTATIFNPVDGSITPIKMGERYTIPSFRGVFVVFD